MTTIRSVYRHTPSSHGTVLPQHPNFCRAPECDDLFRPPFPCFAPAAEGLKDAICARTAPKPDKVFLLQPAATSPKVSALQPRVWRALPGRPEQHRYVWMPTKTKKLGTKKKKTTRCHTTLSTRFHHVCIPPTKNTHPLNLLFNCQEKNNLHLAHDLPSPKPPLHFTPCKPNHQVRPLVHFGGSERLTGALPLGLGPIDYLVWSIPADALCLATRPLSRFGRGSFVSRTLWKHAPPCFSPRVSSFGGATRTPLSSLPLFRVCHVSSWSGPLGRATFPWVWQLEPSFLALGILSTPAAA